MVIVLVDGDLSAIEHVKLAVENNIPVVIIEGTGGAADLLAKFMYTIHSLILTVPKVYSILSNFLIFANIFFMIMFTFLKIKLLFP